MVRINIILFKLWPSFYNSLWSSDQACFIIWDQACFFSRDQAHLSSWDSSYFFSWDLSHFYIGRQSSTNFLSSSNELFVLGLLVGPYIKKMSKNWTFLNHQYYAKGSVPFSWVNYIRGGRMWGGGGGNGRKRKRI